MGQPQCGPAAVCEGIQRELHNGVFNLKDSCSTVSM